VSPAAHVTTQVISILSRVIQQNARRLSADLPKAANGDRDAIHDVRVASRRLRAALPIAGEATRTDVRAIIRTIRKVTRAFSGLREADVVLELVQAWPASGSWSALALTRLETRCDQLRAQEFRASRDAMERVDLEDLTAQCVTLGASLKQTAEPGAVALALAGETRRRVHALQEAITDTGIVYAVEPLHRIRLAAKKLRYTLEVASRALPAAGSKARRQLKGVQSRLGDLHDLQILQQHVREAAAEAAADPALSADLKAMDRAIEVRCRQAHAGILRTRPRLDAALTDVDRAAAALIVPRAVGRMARMQGHRGRKTAAG